MIINVQKIGGEWKLAEDTSKVSMTINLNTHTPERAEQMFGVSASYLHTLLAQAGKAPEMVASAEAAVSVPDPAAPKAKKAKKKE